MAQLTVSEGPNVQKLLYESETIRFCMEKCYNPEIFVLFISSPCCVSQLSPRFDSLPMHICLKSNQPLVPPKCSAVPNPQMHFLTQPREDKCKQLSEVWKYSSGRGEALSGNFTFWSHGITIKGNVILCCHNPSCSRINVDVVELQKVSCCTAPLGHPPVKHTRTFPKK